MTNMNYVCLFAGPDGETYFEDVAVALTGRDDVSQQAPFAVSDPLSAERLLFGSFPPGWRTEYQGPRRQFIVILAGSAAIRTSDGELRRFQAGDVFLADDATGNGHITWNDGDNAVLAAIIPLRD